ncbi:MAG TPA: hypothetical protein VKV40_10950 [Ktedonobacteraceae bacterium]|nr:hypothetical protein [Ktedonobacteraceae bacterium]
MADISIMHRRERHLQVSRVLVWLVGVVSVALVVFLSARLALQFYTTPPLHHLVLEQDIPLPGPFPPPSGQSPLAPGRAERFDHFDFQALDPKTHLLFIAHSGPAPDREVLINHTFNPETDSKTDGNVLVFDTVRHKLLRVLPIPQVAGMVAAPDLGRVYAADANDSIIYTINERTFQLTQIKLDINDGPDAIEYDPLDHKIFVSDPGAPPEPDVSMVTLLKNENVAVIDALTNKLITWVPLGLDGKWGDDVGHTRYDPTSHLVYTVTLPLQDPDSPNLLPAPPSYLAVIDPVTNRLLKRIRLPDACLTPHGLVIDPRIEIAYMACIDSNPVPILVRVDLRTQKPIVEDYPTLAIKPDILAMDYSRHLLFVGCAAAITVFQEQGRALKKIGEFQVGGNTHTVAVNQQTHEIYLPVPSIGGRPTLRIMTYDSNGVN